MHEIYEDLLGEFGERSIVSWFDPQRVEEEDPKKKPHGECSIQVSPYALKRVAIFLRQNSDHQFDNLMCLSSLDQTGENPAYVLVYSLFSFLHRHRCHLRVELSKDAPQIESVHKVWSGAAWFEREAYDLMGIVFENHPDLRRILLPQDWTGHPLRKDYAFPTEYNGIDNTRESLMDLKKKAKPPA